MIGKERLDRFKAEVAHMRDVHKRAVLLNMSVFANTDRLRREERWIIKGNHKKASDLSVRSTKVLRKATTYLYNLEVAHENPLVDGWEVTVNASIRGLENCTCEMRIVENKLAEVYPESIRDALKDWLLEFHFREAFFSEDEI